MNVKKSKAILMFMRLFIIIGSVILLMNLYGYIRMLFLDASLFEPKMPKEVLLAVTGMRLENILIATGIASAKTATILQASFIQIQKIIQMVIFVLTYRLLKGMLHEESPFRSVRARKIGNLALLYLLIPLLYAGVCSALLLVMKENVSLGYSFEYLLYMQFSFLVPQLLVVCLILGVAKAFQHGSVLQEELDETL